MTFQKIMVPFLERTSSELAFQVASGFARRFNAHLDVIHMRQRITPTLSGNAYYPFSVTYIEENVDALRAAHDLQAAELKALFQRLCSEGDISLAGEADHVTEKGATASWTDVTATMPSDLAYRARIADLTVLAKNAENAAAYEFEMIEEVVFQSGRGALLIDGAQPMPEIPQTVLIAWNGGREAARAAASALPVLKQAKLVIVVSVGDLRWGLEPVDHVASYLRLHGVHATHMKARLTKDSEPEVDFLTLAKKKDANLIVMGAYSRSRWREVILGGFTRYLLKNSQIPLLITH